MRIYCQLLLSGFLLVLSISSNAEAMLDRVASLAKAGTTQLALGLIDDSQSKLDQTTSAEQWMKWEHQRFAIYQQQKDWSAIKRRVDEFPVALPDGFRQWALLQGVDTSLSTGDTKTARRYLNKLIQTFPETDVLVVAHWQRLIIHSYLLEGGIERAEKLLARYKQEFSEDATAWQLLQARIHLQNSNPGKAFEVVTGIQSYEGQTLRLLAGLRSRVYSPVEALNWALVLARKTTDKPVLNREIWSIAAEASQLAGDRIKYMIALEQYLSFDNPVPSNSGFRHYTGTDLWKAYESVAENIGNAKRLLVGNDSKWIKLAKSLETNNADAARAIYAFLIQIGEKKNTREIANLNLISRLYNSGQNVVVNHLYIKSERFSAIESMPNIVRHRLAMEALQNHNPKLAARLIHNLGESPKDVNETKWRLQHARILIYAGKASHGIAQLKVILSDSKLMTEETAREVIKLLFDLQGTNHHLEAISLFKTLFPRVKSDQVRRELYFWIADSEKALNNLAGAAELYLKSAEYKASTVTDNWRQIALFQAAETMVKAGMTNDARLVYERLLKIVSDPDQRVIIKKNIRKLWRPVNKAS